MTANPTEVRNMEHTHTHTHTHTEAHKCVGVADSMETTCALTSACCYQSHREIPYERVSSNDESFRCRIYHAAETDSASPLVGVIEEKILIVLVELLGLGEIPTAAFGPIV